MAKFTTKNVSIDTATKTIKVFTPEEYTGAQLYRQLNKLWSTRTDFSKSPFPVEYRETLKLDNGWVMDQLATHKLKNGFYG